MTKARARASKPVGRLTQRDLRECPVWEYVAEPKGRETEEWVRPRPDVGALSRASLAKCFNVVVAAEFTFPDGSRRPGRCGALTAAMLKKLMNESAGAPPELATVVSLDPVVFGRSGPVAFSTGFEPDAAALARLYRRLGLSAKAVFPLDFRPVVPVSSGVVASGRAPGFLWSERAWAFTV